MTRLLDQIFSDIKFKYMYHYLDDLVVYSESSQEHVQHVREVLDRLRRAKLTVKLSKMSFVTSQLQFLGHIVNPAGVQINSERTTAIREFPAPKSVKSITRFIGMVNLFSKFIPEFAETAELLNRLRRKGVHFQWREEQERAFGRLKEAIASPKVLAMADFSREFVLQTDACGYAVAAVLLQEFPEGKRAVAYASCTITVQEGDGTIFRYIYMGIVSMPSYVDYWEQSTNCEKITNIFSLK